MMVSKSLRRSIIRLMLRQGRVQVTWPSGEEKPITLRWILEVIEGEGRTLNREEYRKLIIALKNSGLLKHYNEDYFTDKRRIDDLIDHIKGEIAKS